MMDINKALLEHLKITLAEYEAGGWGSVDTRFRVPASIVKVFRTNLIGFCQLEDNAVLTTDASWHGGQQRNADGIRQIPVLAAPVKFPYYFVLDSAGKPLASASIDKEKFEPVAVNDVLTSAYYDTKYWEERHYERLLSIVKGYQESGPPHGVVATLNNNVTALTIDFKNLIFTVRSNVFDAARCFAEVALTYLTAVFNNHEVLRAFTSPQALVAQIFPEDITKLRQSVFNAIQYAAKNNQFWEKASSSGYNQGNVALTVEPTQWLLTQDMFGKKALNMLESADFDLYEIVEVKNASPVLNKRQERLEVGIKGEYQDSDAAGLVPLNKLRIELAKDDKLDDVTLLTKRAVETDEFIASVKGPKGDPGKDSTVPGPPGPKGDPGSVYDDTALRQLIINQEITDSYARTSLLNEIKAHKTDLGIKQYTPHHNFDIVSVQDRELRDIYQNNLSNWPLVLRRVFNAMDRRADVFTTIGPFDWFGLEFRKNDNSWISNFFKDSITTETLKLVANNQNNVKIAIRQFGIYFNLFVIIDDVIQNKGIEWDTTSDNFTTGDITAATINLVKMLSRLWVQETFSSLNTYITDANDNIKNLATFVSSKAANPTWTNITANYKRRNFTNDYGKYIRITTAIRTIVGELTQNYRIGNYDKTFNGVYAKSFLVDGTPSQSFLWVIGPTTLTYQNSTTSYNLTNDRIYHFRLTPNEAITKIEILESSQLVKILSEAGLINEAGLSKLLRDKLGLDDSLKLAKTELVASYDQGTRKYNILYVDSEVFDASKAVEYSVGVNIDTLTFNYNGNHPGGQRRIFHKVVATHNSSLTYKWKGHSLYTTQATLLANKNNQAGSVRGRSVAGDNEWFLRDFYAGQDYRIDLTLWNNGNTVTGQLTGVQHKLPDANWNWPSANNLDQYYEKKTAFTVKAATRNGTVLRNKMEWYLEKTDQSNTVGLGTGSFIIVTRVASA